MKKSLAPSSSTIAAGEPDSPKADATPMTGLGSLPPVAEAFRLAKERKPDLRRVGLVWNPTEANSVAAAAVGREICRTLGITLGEAEC